MKRPFDIEEFGACPDGRTLNTRAIQKAMDACHDAGGGRVFCGPGTFLTGSLQLRSRVDLHLSLGCRLVGSTKLEDYDDFSAPGFRSESVSENSLKTLLRAIDVDSCSITGPGEINGSGPAFYDTTSLMWGRFYAKPPLPRPRLLMAYRCRNLRIEDASFNDSPCWTFWLMQCQGVRIHRITMRGDQKMINNDGIDLDMCRDVTVSDSIFQTGDDCLILRAMRHHYETEMPCENVTVSNCVLDSWCQGIRIGCPSDGVIRNATFSNLVINSTGNGILFEYPKRYLAPDGQAAADVSRLLFSNLVIDCKGTPIGLVVESGIRLSRLAGISFSHCRIRSGAPCRVQGSPETVIEDIRFSHVNIETSGEDAIVCRHARGVALSDVVLSNRSSADRPG